MNDTGIMWQTAAFIFLIVVLGVLLTELGYGMVTGSPLNVSAHLAPTPTPVPCPGFSDAMAKPDFPVNCTEYCNYEFAGQICECRMDCIEFNIVYGPTPRK